MPLIRIADPFAPQTHRRGGHGPCGRRQHHQQQQPQATGGQSGLNNPLLDLLSAFEKEFLTPNEHTQKTQSKPQPKKTITPNFDVIETDTSYILQGDLPGVHDKKSIDIEFSDAQTLLVKGEVARRYVPKAQSTTTVDTVAVVVEPKEEPLPVYSEKASSASVSDTASTHSHQPSVEETVDESDSGSDNGFEVVESPSTVKASPSPATEQQQQQQQQEQEQPTTSEEKGKQREIPASWRSDEPEQTQSLPVVAPQETPQQQAQPEVKQKFWLNERSVGVFERVFTFEHLINQDAVTASLEYGVLEIVVPKREKYVRRVVIQ